MKTLSKLLQLIDNISIFTGKAFSFLVIPIMLLQAIEVFLRYVLNRPTIWIWELCVYLFGLMFVIGGAWVLQEDRHVRTDVFAQKFTKRQSAIIESFLYPVLGFVFLIPLTDGQIQAAIKSIIGKEISLTLQLTDENNLPTLLQQTYTVSGVYEMDSPMMRKSYS